MSIPAKAIQIHPLDNVAVAIIALAKNNTITVNSTDIKLISDIPAGHKFALNTIKRGVNITKYGFRIGKATADIQPGEWVHEHNVKTALAGDFLEKPELVTPNISDRDLIVDKTFLGYQRKNGEIGIRNEIWIIPTVGCVNATARSIAENACKKQYNGIDGCYAFEHPYGCSQLGGDHERTKKILAGLVNHPNAGGVLVLGLGCENNQVSQFKESLGEYDPERVRFLITQEVEDEFEEAESIISELTVYASSFQQQKYPLNKLKIGLKCGGSDAFSGLSANPLLGVVSEIMVNAGGSVALTEIPEIFGAEGEFLPPLYRPGNL